MSKEIQFVDASGNTDYVNVINSAGEWWSTVAVGFVAYVPANFADYAIAATEFGASQVYYADFPGSAPADSYSVIARTQAGGSPAESDVIVSNGELDWTGSSVGSLSRVVLADAAIHGGATASLRLGSTSSTPAFYVTNSAGSAAQFETSKAGAAGLYVKAGNDGYGLWGQGLYGFFGQGGGAAGVGFKSQKGVGSPLDTDLGTTNELKADVSSFGGTAGTFAAGIPDVRMAGGIQHGGDDTTLELSSLDGSKIPLEIYTQGAGTQPAIEVWSENGNALVMYTTAGADHVIEMTSSGGDMVRMNPTGGASGINVQVGGNGNAVLLQGGSNPTVNITQGTASVGAVVITSTNGRALDLVGSDASGTVRFRGNNGKPAILAEVSGAGDAVKFSGGGGAGAGLRITGSGLSGIISNNADLGTISNAFSGNITGNLSGSVGSVATGGITTTSFAANVGFNSVLSNTAQTGTLTTIRLNSGASSVNDFYKGQVVRLTGGQGSGQSRVITAYDGTTKDATVDYDWVTAPNNTTTFAILPYAEPKRDASLQVTVGAFAADSITSAAIAAGAIGVSEAPNLDVAVSSRLASASYIAPNNADVAAIKVKTDQLTFAGADVNANVAAMADGVVTDAKVAVPAVAGVATGVLSMIVQLWRRFFKKATHDSNAGQIKTFADDGSTVLTTQASTEAGGVETQGGAV